MNGITLVFPHWTTCMSLTTINQMEASIENLKCVSAVVKIASRCNLNCTYCYMYNLGDETYKQQPKFMDRGVQQALFQKVKNHCLRHDIEQFQFILHGGEPMLAGKEFFRNFFDDAKAILEPDIKIVFSMQTNALLLSTEWCNLLSEYNVSIGISLDGTREANDRYRIDHAGRGSYDRIIKGLKITQEHEFYAGKRLGLLSVLNIESDPIECYEHFKELKAPAISFLLPDNNFDLPPPLPKSGPLADSETPYGDWLIQVFDRWIEDGKDKPGIGLFERIMGQIIGGQINSDSLGGRRNEILVIETNGGIESVDVLKICGNGFTKNSANVLSHELDDALQTDLAKLYHLSHEWISAQCRSCPVQHLCGGGYIPHRYSSERGFDNPSVYCKDLLKLITHIQNAVLGLLPAEVLEDTGVTLLTYEDAQQIMQEEMALAEEPDYTEALQRFSR